MKRAVILHGTDGKPDSNWFMWCKAELEKAGYEVWIPELPNNHTPNRQVYNDFLLDRGWDFNSNLIIGHSSGAVSVLNLLMDGRCPRIKAACMVGVWANNEGTELDKEQFKYLFPAKGFDFELIKSKTDNFIYVHGSDDPFCPIDQAKWLSSQTGGEFVTVPNGHHLGSVRTQLPELIEALQNNHIL